jgi:hypothetical protein
MGGPPSNDHEQASPQCRLDQTIRARAALPFPFGLAVLDDYQFVHGSGGALPLLPHKRMVSLDLACKS